MASVEKIPTGRLLAEVGNLESADDGSTYLKMHDFPGEPFLEVLYESRLSKLDRWRGKFSNRQILGDVDGDGIPDTTYDRNNPSLISEQRSPHAKSWLIVGAGVAVTALALSAIYGGKEDSRQSSDSVIPIEQDDIYETVIADTVEINFVSNDNGVASIICDVAQVDSDTYSVAEPSTEFFRVNSGAIQQLLGSDVILAETVDQVRQEVRGVLESREKQELVNYTPVLQDNFKPELVSAPIYQVVCS